jgi:deoxyribodipyrimidine photo-lyase
LRIIEKNISCHSFKDQVIFEEKRNNKADGLPYTIYTPYIKNKWLAKYESMMPVEEFDTKAAF